MSELKVFMSESDMLKDELSTLRTRLQQVESERDSAIKEVERLRLLLPTTARAMVYESLLMKFEQAEADASVMRGLLGDSKRVLSRVLDWCLMDSPNFEIDGDAIGEAVHNINVFEGKSTLNPKPQDVM